MKHSHLSVKQNSEWNTSQEEEQDPQKTSPESLTENLMDLKEVKQFPYNDIKLFYTQLLLCFSVPGVCSHWLWSVDLSSS